MPWLHGVCMGLVIAYRQQSAMNHWVQCFYTPVHHSGKPVNSDTSRQSIPACVSIFAVPPVEIISILGYQSLCEINNAGLVRDRYQGAGNGLKRWFRI